MQASVASWPDVCLAAIGSAGVGTTGRCLRCVTGLVVAGPTSARVSLIVHEQGVRKHARSFTRRRSLASRRLSRCQSRIEVVLVSWGWAYRSARTPGTCGFEGGVVALALTV